MALLRPEPPASRAEIYSRPLARAREERRAAAEGSPLRLLAALARSLGAPTAVPAWSVLLRRKALRHRSAAASNDELLASSLFALHAAGRPAARAACEALCRSVRDAPGLDAALRVVLLLGDLQDGVDPGLGPDSRRALYGAGLAGVSCNPSSFFRPRAQRQPELELLLKDDAILKQKPSPWLQFGLEGGGAKAFAEPDPEDGGLDSLDVPPGTGGATAAWLEPWHGALANDYYAADSWLEPDLFEPAASEATTSASGGPRIMEEPELEPDVRSSGAEVVASPALSTFTAEPEAAEAGTEGPPRSGDAAAVVRGSEASREVSVVLQDIVVPGLPQDWEVLPLAVRLRLDAKVLHSIPGPVELRLHRTSRWSSRLRKLWMPSAGCIQLRAEWEDPYRYCLLGGAWGKYQECGELWVNDASLALHGVSSRFFLARPGPDAVAFRGAWRDASGWAALSTDWATLGARCTRLRALAASGGRRAAQSSRGLIFEAFSHAVSHVLCELDQAFSELVAKRECSRTPLALWVHARPWARQVEELALLCSCSSSRDSALPKGLELLEHLCRQCKELQVSGCRWQADFCSADAPSKSTACLGSSFIFAQALEPYLRCIARWSFHGELVDPYAEFSASHGAQAGDRLPLVPSFLASVAPEIRRSGSLLTTLAASEELHRAVAGSEGAGGAGGELENAAAEPRAATASFAEDLSQFFNHEEPLSDGHDGDRCAAGVSRRTSYPFALHTSVQACRAQARRVPRGRSWELGPSAAAWAAAVDVSKSTPRASRPAHDLWSAPARAPTFSSSATPRTMPRGEWRSPADVKAEEKSRHQQAQQLYRAALDEQLAQNRAAKAAGAAAVREETPEAPMLSVRSTQPGAVEAATANILREHQREMAEKNAYAALLHWRLQRVRLGSQRQHCILDDQAAWRRRMTEYTESSGRTELDAASTSMAPAEHWRASAHLAASLAASWGSVVNPFGSALARLPPSTRPSASAATTPRAAGLSTAGQSARALGTPRTSENANVGSFETPRAGGVATARLSPIAFGESIASSPTMVADASVSGTPHAAGMVSARLSPLAFGESVASSKTTDFAACSLRRPGRDSVWSPGVVPWQQEDSLLQPLSPHGESGHLLESPLSGKSCFLFVKTEDSPRDDGRREEVRRLSQVVRRALYVSVVPHVELLKEVEVARAAAEAAARAAALQPTAVAAAGKPSVVTPRRPATARSDASSSSGAQLGATAPAVRRRPPVLASLLDDANLSRALDQDPDARCGAVSDARWAAAGGAVPVEAALERCVLRPLAARAKVLDSAIVEHLLTDVQLVGCLRLLTRYVLMGESRLLEHFVIEVLDRYAAPGAMDQVGAPLGGLEGAINVLFEAVVPHPQTPSDERLFSGIHFAIVESPSPLGAGPLKFLEAMRLDFRVDFPLSTFFSERVLAQYSRLFQLLALVHYSSHGVKNAWSILAKVFVGKKSTGTRIPTAVLALRHHVHLFLTTLQRYLLVDVVAAEFFCMEARLMGANSLEEMRAAHASFLEMCEFKAFLGLGGREILATVLALLQQALRLCRALAAAAAEVQAATAAGLAPRVPAGVLRELQGLEVTFHDLRWKLKLCLVDAGTTLDPIANGNFKGLRGPAAVSAAAQASVGGELVEEWLLAWSRRCSQ